MPTLPSAASFGDRPTPEEQLPPVAPQGVEIAGQALAGAARQTFSSELSRIQAQNRYDLMVGRQQLITAQLSNREKLQDDPDFATHEQRFRAGMQQDSQNVIANTTNPRIKGELAQYAQLETERGGLVVRHEAIAKGHSFDVADTLDRLETLRQSALSAPDDSTRAAAVLTAQGLIDASIAKGSINAVQGQELRQRWTQNYAHGAVEMLPFDQQVKTLSNPKGTPAEFLEPDHRAEMLRTAQAHVDEANHKAMMEARQEIAANMGDANAAAIRGLPVPPSAAPNKAKLKAAYPEDWGQRWAEYQNNVQFGNDMNAMRLASPDQIQAMRDRYAVTQGGQGAKMAIERQDAFDRASNQVAAERRSDPARAAIDAGLWKPLNFQDPQAFAQELTRRVAAAPEISRQFGTAVQPLTKDEAHAVATTLENQTPQQQLQMLTTLKSSAGSDAGYQKVMSQVLPSSPVVAIVGQRQGFSDPTTKPVWFDGEHAQNTADAATILTGERLLNPQGAEKVGGEKNAKSFPMPPTEAGTSGQGLRQKFAKQAGDTFRGRPEASDAYYAAYRAAYAGLAAKDGDLSGTYNDTRSKQAFGMAVGQVKQVGTSSIVVPQGMDSSRFQSILDAAIGARAKEFGAPAGFEDKIKGYSLEEVGGIGSGRYRLLNGNAVLVRPDKPRIPFEVDLRSQFDPTKGAVGGPGDQARAAAQQTPQ